jgi:hypothetical protein
MSDRKMTDKAFLKVSSGSVSAAAFLAAHRDYLTSGTLASYTAPILAKLDAGQVFPTPALQEVRQAVLDHMMQRISVKAAPKAAEPKEPKAYSAKVLDSEGRVVMRLTEEGESKACVQEFDLYQRAEGWADRRLFEGEPGGYAEITFRDGKTYSIERDDAMARILKQPRMAVHKGGRREAPLGNNMRAKGDHFHFSRG